MKHFTPVLFLSLALSLPAHSAVVFKSGNWVLDDSLPNDPGKGVCQAMTSGSFGNAVTYLSVVVDKSGAMPTEVYLLPNRPSLGVPALQAQSNSGQQWYFPKLVRTGANDQYWQVPVDTTKFLNDIKAGSQLVVKAVSGSTNQLRLSLSGSTAVINELAKRCSKSSLFVSAPFEKAFLPADKDRFDVKTMSPEKASRLRALIAEAVPAFYKFRAVEVELQALEARFAGLTKERGALRAELDNLKSRVLPELMNGRDAAQAKIDRATNEIVDLETKIAQKQHELAGAKAIADAAYERLRPLIPEHNRLLQQRRNDESRLSDARSTLADIDGGIAQEQQNISRINSEINQLNRALPSAQEEVRRSQYGLDEANRAYQAFDPRREFHERLRRNHRMDQLEREIRQGRERVQGLQRQVQQQQGAVQAHQNTVNAAQRALNQCRGQAAVDFGGRVLANDESSNGGIGRPGFGNPGGRPDGRPGHPGRPGDGPGFGNPGEGGGIGDRPDRPRPPRPDPRPDPQPQPPPQPAPNCSAQEAALASAQAQLSSAQQQLWNLQNQQRGAENDLERDQREAGQIRDNIQREVQDEQNRLSQRVGEWQSQLQRMQSELGRIQDRLDNLLRYDLPRAQNNLRDFESRRPGALAEVQGAENALYDSSEAYNRYKQSVDYDNIKGESDRSAAVVRGIESTIAESQRGIASRQALIREQTALRESLVKRIADTHATIAAKETRLAEVDRALASYDELKAEIVARLDATMAVLKEISDRYSAALK